MAKRILTQLEAQGRAEALGLLEGLPHKPDGPSELLRRARRDVARTSAFEVAAIAIELTRVVADQQGA